MGQPKAELRVCDRPILAYLLDRFRWNGPTMLVTAPSRRSPSGTQLFDREVADPLDGAGPLRGVLSALENLTTSVAIIATVDMPGIGAAQLQWLQSQFNTAPDGIGVMCRRHDHVETFPSIYRAGALDLVSAAFTAGERSVVALSRLPGVRAIDAPADWDDRTWTNLNTPDDFATFVASLSAP